MGSSDDASMSFAALHPPPIPAPEPRTIDPRSADRLGAKPQSDERSGVGVRAATQRRTDPRNVSLLTNHLDGMTVLTVIKPNEQYSC
jgi:hypothetical protein